jgi:hypothetical protein
MWLEKLCKAYVYKASLDTLKNSHNVVAKILPSLIKEHWRSVGSGFPPRTVEIHELCREIDLLHPQIDHDGRRPENVEYPWVGSSGNIAIPAQSKFSLAGRLESSSGRILLKASKHLTGSPALFSR